VRAQVIAVTVIEATDLLAYRREWPNLICAVLLEGGRGIAYSRFIIHRLCSGKGVTWMRDGKGMIPEARCLPIRQHRRQCDDQPGGSEGWHAKGHGRTPT